MKKTLILFLLLCLLTACGQTEEAPSDGITETPMASAESAGELSADTVILTVGGQPVYRSEFEYYLTYIIDFYKSANGLETITDWNVETEGKPLAEYFMDYAVSLAKNHRGLEAMAAELDAGMTAEQAAAIDDAIADGEEVYGSGEYRRMVEESYNTMELFRYLQEIGYLTDNVFAAVYGQEGKLCDDSTVAEFAAENGYMCVKFICVEDTDENRTLMDELSARLKASDDPDALFDELMDEYSQYTTLTSESFPQGQLFGRGYLGDAFDRGYANLSDGEISGVLEGPNELYIIQRLPLDPDGTKNEGGFTLRHCVAYALFEQDMENRGNELDCILEDGYYAVEKELK